MIKIFARWSGILILCIMFSFAQILMEHSPPQDGIFFDRHSLAEIASWICAFVAGSLPRGSK